MHKTAKIYIAGHRGLVGSAIARKLKNEGFTNIVTRTRDQLDLVRQDQVERFFDVEHPEFVFLAAAKVGGILANSTYKAEFIHENIAIADNVIHSAYRSGVKKLLNLGSSCIYPKLAPQPMSENCLLTGALESTNEPYAIAKIAAIKLCRYYNEQYGTNFISVMPTNLYGPNDNYNLETAHALPALIRKFYLAQLLREKKYEALLRDLRSYPIGFGIDTHSENIQSAIPMLEKLGITGEHVSLWGSGKPYREFLHVDDLADAAFFLMRSFNYGEIGELINVGSGTDQTIAETAMLIKNIVGFKGAILHDSSKPDGTPKKLLDVSKLSRLGWNATISLEDGIRKTFSWYTSTRQQLEHVA